MPVYRHSYLFEAGKIGWQETWYRNVNADLDTAHAAFGATCALRSAICANGVSIIAWKTQQTDAPRVGRISPYAAVRAPVAGNNRDSGWMNVLYRMRDASGVYRRTVTLRGVPDIAIVLGPDGVPMNDTLNDAVQAWFQAIRTVAPGIGLAWRALDRAGSNLPVVVSNVSVVPPATLLQFTANGHAIGVGEFVTIRGLQGQNIELNPPSKKTLNGIWKVVSVPDFNTFTTKVQFTDVAGTPIITKQGTVRRRVFTYPGIAGLDYLKSSRRQAGRAFFVPSGRRRSLRQRA